MKKVLLTAMLAFAVSAAAQDASTQPAGQPAAQQQKVIKDPAEYNAYTAAIGTSDPNQKIAQLEAFVQQYPSSVVKDDALEAIMVAYQTTGNAAKSTETAARILQTNPSNVTALAVFVYSKRNAANSGQNSEQNLADAADPAQRGLVALQTWQKPEGVTPADFEKQKAGLAAIFNGTAGQAALVKKDYPNAQKYLLEAARLDPTNFYNIWFTANALLSPKPNTDENMLKGIWYAAKAASLAPQAPDVAKFGKFYYKKYHGHESGWEQVIQQANTQPTMPANFTVTKFIPPSPSETAAKMITEKDISKMDFGEWIFILTSGNQDAAAKVWSTLEGKLLKFQGQVIESSKSKLGLAVTADGIEVKKTEVEVMMLEPLRTAPAVGSDFQLQAVPTSYTANPFLILMEQGSAIGKSASSAAPTSKAKGKAKAKAKKKKR